MFYYKLYTGNRVIINLLFYLIYFVIYFPV